MKDLIKDIEFNTYLEGFVVKLKDGREVTIQFDRLLEYCPLVLVSHVYEEVSDEITYSEKSDILNLHEICRHSAKINLLLKKQYEYLQYCTHNLEKIEPKKDFTLLDIHIADIEDMDEFIEKVQKRIDERG